MYNYQAFGLKISSDVKLQELLPARDDEQAPDLSIRLRDLEYNIPEIGTAPAFFDYEDENGCLMMWPGAICARIASEDLIEIQPYEGVPERYLGFPILGPILGWLLHMRGLFVLHASAVVWEGKTITFLGDKGAGKSTTATAFLQAGAKLLTDDLLAIDVDNPNGPKMLPAFPQIKLCSDANVSVSVPDAERLPLVMEGFEKRQFRLGEMYDAPIQCDYIVTLQRTTSEPKLEWISGQEALMNLLRFSYNVRFSDAPIRLQRREQHFKNAAIISKHAKCGKFFVSTGPEQLQQSVACFQDYILSNEL